MHFPRNLLALLLANFTLLVLISTNVGAKQTTAAKQQVQITAEQMCCKSCVRKISSKLYAAKGVQTVAIDLKTRVVSVELPKPSPTMLGKLWRAVEQGDGKPSKLVTAKATYTFSPSPQLSPGQSNKTIRSESMQVDIDHLHCKSCAKKIANKLYTIPGVTLVKVEMSKNRLIVEKQTQAAITPWQIVAAVLQAKERPVRVASAQGLFSIEWAAPSQGSQHQPTKQAALGGIQR